MAVQISALLVHARNETLRELTHVLKSLGMRVTFAGTCREAAKLLERQGAIDLVFAGTDLADGGWADVLGLAQQSKSYLPVIVVSQIVDSGLYLDVISRGAFDFITPPFLTSDMAHVVRSAIYKELVSVQRDLTAPPAA